MPWGPHCGQERTAILAFGSLRGEEREASTSNRPRGLHESILDSLAATDPAGGTDELPVRPRTPDEYFASWTCTPSGRRGTGPRFARGPHVESIGCLAIQAISIVLGYSCVRRPVVSTLGSSVADRGRPLDRGRCALQRFDPGFPSGVQRQLSVSPTPCTIWSYPLKSKMGLPPTFLSVAAPCPPGRVWARIHGPLGLITGTPRTPAPTPAWALLQWSWPRARPFRRHRQRECW